ncbi:MAG: FtsW/RodA/SpoVE family cell cycle protein, partial [Oscillospiraceae bacterium]
MVRSSTRKLNRDPKVVQKIKEKKPPMDMVFFILVIAITCFGLVMLFSASYSYCYYRYGNSYFYIQRQFVWAVVGVVVMLVASRFPYKIFKRFSWVIYIVSCVLLAITLV